MINLRRVLTELSKERPIFHSEADFQFALAWKIKEEYSELNLLLEKPFKREERRRKHIDILVIDTFSNEEIPIELKYKTLALEEPFKDKIGTFDLTNQTARDQGRHGFLEDISRIEEYLVNSSSSIGFVILLTNDSNYWNEKTNKTDDEEFKIFEGRKVSGRLDWRKGTSNGTKNGKGAIILSGKYEMRWTNYSELEDKKGIFRYLIIKVQGK